MPAGPLLINFIDTGYAFTFAFLHIFSHLSLLFYHIFLQLYRAGLYIASFFHPKAKKWVQGRKGLFNSMEKAITPGQKIIWVHCASLGEFEQGRPVIESIKTNYPAYKVLLTFFSPSGYEAQKNFAGADWVFYLPMDGPKSSKRFLEIVNPQLAIFVKYEFWFFYLKKLKYRGIPLLLISALFREDMSFFKWHGKLQRKMLSRFNHLFVQNVNSKQLIDNIGLGEMCTISGDTRFDRVAEIASRFEPVPNIEKFIDDKKTIVAGSTWPEDEDALRPVLTSQHVEDRLLKVIIAPHDISTMRISTIEKIFEGAVRYSQLNNENILTTEILIIDNIGLLSRLYHYADICYVGGGFSKTGIHNVLEAAVYAKPVVWGPNYKKYAEAIELLEAKGGYSVNQAAELKSVMEELLSDENLRKQLGENAGAFIQANTGATKIILTYIQENRLLTN